jgi:two-component system, NtrC family, sensor histidine kinase HydH
MGTDVWRQYQLTSRWMVSPRLLVPVALAAMGIILVSGLLEYQSRKSEAEQLFAMQGENLLEALAISADQSLTAANRMETEITSRILSNLNLLTLTDRGDAWSSRDLHTSRDMAKFNVLAVFHADGTLQAASGNLPLLARDAMTGDFIEAVNQGLVDRYVMFLPDSTGNDAMVGFIRRPQGGVIVGGVDAEHLQELRQVFGLGRLLTRLQAHQDVEYLVVQNEEAIIAGSFDSYDLTGIASDAFLADAMAGGSARTRIMPYADNRVFEAVIPFYIDGAELGILRAGISLEQVDAMNARAQRRLIITGALGLIIAVALLSFVIGHRQRRVLRDGFVRLQQYTNTILEHQGSGVLAVSADGLIQVCNREAARILCTSPGDSLGRPLQSIHVRLAEQVDEAMAQQREITVPKRLDGCRNGLAVSLRTTLLQEQAPEGEPPVCTCILILDDITEQVRLENQVRRQEKLVAMGQLASTVAHEIRNPLNSIGMIVGLLDRRYAPDETDDKYRSKFQSVTKEIGRINDIVEQFIRFARPPKLQVQPADISVIMKDIDTLYQETMAMSQVDWQVAIEPCDNLPVDVAQLKQVLINLVQNAKDALDGPGRIIMTGTVGERGYMITVEDTGIGIPPEDMERIFELYFTNKQQGTGIGLAMAHQIISRHQGTIAVTSTPGTGTTFTIFLPFQEQSEMLA